MYPRFPHNNPRFGCQIVHPLERRFCDNELNIRIVSRHELFVLFFSVLPYNKSLRRNLFHYVSWNNLLNYSVSEF